jgi:prevent-host-death family protein
MQIETVDMDQAQSRLAELVSLASSGTEIIIAEHGTPRARLVPVTSGPSVQGTRVLGLNRGSVAWISDDFDAPLPDEFWASGDEGDSQGEPPQTS